MKNGKKIYIIGLFLFVALIQLLIYFSGAKYDWNVIFWEFLIIFSAVIIFSLLILSTYKKLLRNYNQLNYDYVISKGVKLKKYTSGILHEYITLMLAVAYFTQNEDDKFQLYINEITNKRTIGARHYWLTVFNVLQNRMDEAQKQFELLIGSKDSDHYQFYMGTGQSLLNLGNHEADTENANLENLQSKIRNPRVLAFLKEKAKG